MSSFRLLFLLLIGLLVGNAVVGQVIKRSAGQADVTVKFMMASSYHPAGSITLDKLGGKIDIGKYPDAKISVRVDVTEIRNNVYIELCGSCYSKKLNGFGFPKISGSRRINDKGKHTTVVYSQVAYWVGDNPIRLTVKVYEKGKERFDWDLNSIRYEVINTPTNPNEQAVKKLIAELDEAEKANDKSQAMNACSRIRGYEGQNVGGQKEDLDQMLRLCNSKYPVDPIDPVDDSDQQKWTEVQQRAGRSKLLHEQRNIYQEYLSKFPNGKYASQAQAKVKELRDKESNLSGDKKKAAAAAQREEAERLESIGVGFMIEQESRKNINGGVEYTLRYYNHEGLTPQWHGCSERTRFEHRETAARVVIQVPQGTKCELVASIPGVEFTGKNHIFVIDTEVISVSATYTPQDDGSVKIEIEGGTPPFRVQFLEGDIVEGVKVLVGDQRTYTVSPEDEGLPGGGSYTLMVTDRTGNALAQARSEAGILKVKETRWWMLLVLPLILLVVGGVLYLRYYNKGLEAVPSEKDNQEIAMRIAVDRRRATTRPASKITKASTDASAISISKKEPLEQPAPIVHHLDVAEAFGSLATIGKVTIRHRILERLADRENSFAAFPTGWLLGTKKLEPEEKRYSVSVEQWVPTLMAATPDVALARYQKDAWDVLGWVTDVDGAGGQLSEEEERFHSDHFPAHWQFVLQCSTDQHFHLYPWYKGRGRYQLHTQSEHPFSLADFVK